MSTSDQDTTNQLLQLRRYCEQQGWQIVHEYSDVASGGRSDREQLQRMMTDASRRRFDVVVVWAIDRLSREGAFAVLAYLQRLSAVGVKFASFSEPYISTVGPLGDGVVALLACVAKMEKDRLRQRTLAGLAKARAQGRVGGRKRVISEPDRQQIAALRSEGLSLTAIAERVGHKRSTVYLALKGNDESKEAATA